MGNPSYPWLANDPYAAAAGAGYPPPSPFANGIGNPYGGGMNMSMMMPQARYLSAPTSIGPKLSANVTLDDDFGSQEAMYLTSMVADGAVNLFTQLWNYKLGSKELETRGDIMQAQVAHQTKVAEYNKDVAVEKYKFDRDQIKTMKEMQKEEVRLQIALAQNQTTMAIGLERAKQDGLTKRAELLISAGAYDKRGFFDLRSMPFAGQPTESIPLEGMYGMA